MVLFKRPPFPPLAPPPAAPLGEIEEPPRLPAILLLSIDIVRFTVSRPVINLLLLLISALYVVNEALMMLVRANIAVAAAAGPTTGAVAFKAGAMAPLTKLAPDLNISFMNGLSISPIAAS